MLFILLRKTILQSAGKFIIAVY